MLPAITKKYHDASTYDYFMFVFYCDICGEPWTSEKYPFSLANDKPRTIKEQKVRDIIWMSEHNSAYERANTEAILRFNKCTRCGKRVCDSCFSEIGDTCIDCDNSKTITNKLTR